MKNIIIIILGVSLLCHLAYPQGTINFANLSISGGGVNAPVYEADGITKLSGLQFLAELFAGTSQSNLTVVATTSFLTGNAAGYFAGGTQSLIGVSPGAVAWVQVDVWNSATGASFAQAEASGLPNSWWQSSVFTVLAGGGGINPFPPAVLTGLGNSSLFLNGAPVPEPSAFALGLIGTFLALFRLRRRN